MATRTPRRALAFLPLLPALPVVLAFLVGGGAAGCATVERNEIQDVRDDVMHGQFERAVREAATLSEAHPDDPTIAELHRQTSVAWLIDQGRRATFQDKDAEALASFRQAQAIDPGSKEADDWIRKTIRKLSKTWLERGLELHASGKLVEAVEAYEKALEFAPGDPSALNGLGEAVVQINYREGLGDQYFEDGIRSLASYSLEQARSRFAYADKYDPEDPKVRQRARQANVLLAQQRTTVAKGIEDMRRFGAARNEFRLAVALDPDNAEAKTGLERCTNEAKAYELLAKARMEVVRKRLDHAQELIEEGAGLTVLQKDLFDGARAQIEQARFERKYQEALTLERDFQYPEAIEKYGELLSTTEYYKDAITRKEILEEYVHRAADLYAKAESATSDEEKLGSLRAIRVFWPEYRDVAQQLAKLEPPPEPAAAKPPSEKKPPPPAPKPRPRRRVRPTPPQ
jgi:tetratricopeptide (TPR) repeat protein